ncbi:winged helix-turn-helix transcriptional regulator [Leifsonia flava]|uniref:Transcriptional regulator n=1 Tax=Orlajensenia leifsoniae TaxID=2561933 RepID=A0A4Y9R7L6_9MICO|nr:helix-turn-helix domain-containing protein [Leifsonia flava]TFW00291.1 transcriptional regulator [Leifsonia flava]
MKRADGRSDCPTNFTVEALGDSWSLLILRDILALGKRSFGEFLASDERIGQSVLAERLDRLERTGLVSRSTSPTDARKQLYIATERGIDVIPLLLEAVRWGVGGLPPVGEDDPWMQVLQVDRGDLIAAWQRSVRAGRSLFGDGGALEDLAAAGA